LIIALAKKGLNALRYKDEYAAAQSLKGL